MGCISKNGDNIFEKVLDMGFDDDKTDDVDYFGFDDEVYNE